MQNKGSELPKEHILVCLSSSPSNERIVQMAGKMAQAFSGSLTALYVQTPGDADMNAEDTVRLQRLRDAEQSEFDVIRVVRQPACRIVWIRDSPKVDSYLGLEYSIRKLEQHQKDSLVFLGKVGVGIDKESLEQGGYADYGLVFLLLDDEDEYEGDTVALPETDCVRIRFRGSHGDAPDRYFGERGRTKKNGASAAYDTELYTVPEVERIARVAFDLAMKRNKKLCNVDKVK